MAWVRYLALAAPALPGVAAAVEVQVEPVSDGALADRLADDDAHLVLLVTSEHRGDPLPCGCGVRPLGGLSRMNAYADAVKATGVPVLVLHAGGWSDPTADGAVIAEEARAANQAFARALRAVEVDVLNVGWPDLAALEAPRPGLVSANLLTEEPVRRRVVAAIGGRRVLLTGVTRGGPAYLWRPGTRLVGAVEGVENVLELTPDHDLAVVLAHDDAQAARAVSRVPGVDLVVEAGDYHARWKPLVEEAVHVRTWRQGLRLTELRLWLGDDGLERVVLREVDLDEALDERRKP